MNIHSDDAMMQRRCTWPEGPPVPLAGLTGAAFCKARVAEAVSKAVADMMAGDASVVVVVVAVLG